jgi:hypothetical protein
MSFHLQGGSLSVTLCGAGQVSYKPVIRFALSRASLFNEMAVNHMSSIKKVLTRFIFYFWNEAGLCMAISLVAGIATILVTYRDYGVSWDDWIQSVYGRLVANYFDSGFEDTSCNNFFDMKFYGPLFELAAVAVFPASAEYPNFELRHLLIALTGLGTIAGVIQFARRFNLHLVPAFSALALSMMPQFYGYCFINSKDIPLACAFTWFAVALSHLLTASSISWKTVIATGFTYGIAFSMRPGIAPLIALLTVSAFVYVQLTGNSPVSRWREKSSPASLILKSLSLVFLAWGGMVLFWPWAYENPLMNPVRAIVQAAGFPSTYPVLFEGHIYDSRELPWYYLPKIIITTIPLPILFFATVGMTWGAVALIRRSGKHSGALFITVTWVLAPVLIAVIVRPNIYDGMRHFLFLLPGLALLAGYGAARIVAAGKTRLSRGLLAVIVILALLQSVISIVKLHPYQYCFYNSLAGNLKGAAGKYETDYWVTSYKEAAEWINRNTGSAHQVNVLVAANDLNLHCFTYYLKDAVRVEKIFERNRTGVIPAPFDYYVSTTRYGMDKNFDGATVVGTIGREGAVFTVIKKNPDK